MLLITESEQRFEALEELVDEDACDSFAGYEVVDEIIVEVLRGTVVQFLVELAAFVLF